mmetsp:Transcript_22496/g.40396  ORF Transcript_22496/g.40396 Transcript_22496/m.40396 type:complete len:381 (-) Transcript_22496:71-1213(-)
MASTASETRLPDTFVEGFHDLEACQRMVYRSAAPWNHTSADGKTKPRLLSILGLGTSPFGDVYNKVSQDNVHAVVETALRNGVNVIDTAYWYGQGMSEKRLGLALRDIPRQAYYLHTKCGRYEKEVRKMFDFSAERTLRAVDDALEHLGVEYIDVMQIHDPEYAPSLDIILEETLPALQKAKEAGKIKRIGITGYPLSIHREILKRSKVEIDMCLFYCHYSLNDTTLFEDAELMELLRTKNVEWMNASALSMGLLTPNGPPQWHPAHAPVKEAARKAVALCAENNVSLPKLAVNFSLREPRIPSTLVGAENVEMMKVNLHAATNLDDLSEVEERTLTQLREEIFAPLEQPTWEDMEVTQYKEMLEHAIATNQDGGTLSSN